MEPQYQEQSKSTGLTRSYHPGLDLNTELDRITTGRLVNEKAIEDWLDRLQAIISANDPCFWLLLARLTELAVVCTGRYADACELAAAGDLLVNPREIRVHFTGDTPFAVVKRRHGSLSAQLNTTRAPHLDFIRKMRQTATVEIVQAPLLTFLTDMLATSGLLSMCYLEKVRGRMNRIADTIGFLCSWQVADATDLHRRIVAETRETRQFVQSHLCNFDLNLFAALGHDVQRLANDVTASSDFLNPAMLRLRSYELH
ncbi:MAG: hypothetical protein GY697_10910 [Desulfobacterales bacterium]|nr:hypothetical protein [Desulfobacterales bacterium]